MSDCRIKKKNLNASDVEIILKISDFRSNFQQASSSEEGNKKYSQSPVVSTPKPQVSSTSAGAKMVSSFGIRDAIVEITKEQSKQQRHEGGSIVAPPKINQHNPFDLDAVIACIDRYVEKQNPEQMIVTALKTHQPIVEKDQMSYALCFHPMSSASYAPQTQTRSRSVGYRRDM